MPLELSRIDQLYGESSLLWKENLGTMPKVERTFERSKSLALWQRMQGDDESAEEEEESHRVVHSLLPASARFVRRLRAQNSAGNGARKREKLKIAQNSRDTQ